jgi:dolichol-phosphate mannosyltransferase
MKKKAVIILPTYNERDNISTIIDILVTKVFPDIHNYQMSILVADDMSPDGTADVVKKLMRTNKQIALLSGKKEGLGAAYVRGMSYAIEKMGANVVFEMDSDMQHDPYKIPLFLQKIDEGYDMVIGTRYSDGGSIPQSWALMRKLMSVNANLLMRVITWRWNIHDWTGGYRAITKEVFLKEKDHIRPYHGYTFQLAFLYKTLRDGYRVAEVPFHFGERTTGESKIASVEYIIQALQYVIQERLDELSRFLKFLIVGGTGFVVQVIAQELAVFLRLPHTLAAGIGAEAAILSNFIFNHLWTFEDAKALPHSSNVWVKLIKFNIASMGSIVIQALAVWGAEFAFGENMQLFGIDIATRLVVLIPTIIFLVIPLNYLIYNRFIWKTQYLHKQKN